MELIKFFQSFSPPRLNYPLKTRNYGRPTSGPRDSIKIVSAAGRGQMRGRHRRPLFSLSLFLSRPQRNEKHRIVLWKFNGRRGLKRSLDEI